MNKEEEFHYLEDGYYVEKLEQEIKRLKEENEKLLKKSYSDDVRITKAIGLITNEFLCYGNESNEYIQGKKAINILNGECEK